MLLVAVIVAGALVWLGCGALNYAMLFAYFQREYTLIAERNYHSDRSFALAAGGFGPIGLPAALIGSGLAKHGLKWR